MYFTSISTNVSWNVHRITKNILMECDQMIFMFMRSLLFHRRCSSSFPIMKKRFHPLAQITINSRYNTFIIGLLVSSKAIPYFLAGKRWMSNIVHGWRRTIFNTHSHTAAIETQFLGVGTWCWWFKTTFVSFHEELDNKSTFCLF